MSSKTQGTCFFRMTSSRAPVVLARTLLHCSALFAIKIYIAVSSHEPVPCLEPVPSLLMKGQVVGVGVC